MTGPTDKTSTLKFSAAAKDGSISQGDLLHDSHTGYGGEALRAEREKAGVDIPTLSFELRIPQNYLRALESEDYDELPGTTYGFGYIKSYCKFLGIEDTPFLDTYKMRTAMAGQGPSYHFPDEALEPRMSGAMTAMLVVLALLSGYIGWQVYDRYSPSSIDAPTTAVTSVTIDEAPSATNKTDEAQDTAALDTPSQTAEDEVGTVQEEVTLIAATNNDADDANDADKGQDSQQADAAEEEVVVAEADVPAQTDAPSDAEEAEEDVAAVAKQETDVAEQSTSSAQNTSSAQANVREPQEEIVISANAAAWVEVVSENGDVILSKLFQAGEEYIAPAEKKLYLSTGNAGGLVLMIPGLDSFQAGAVGEIIRDLPLSRESIRSRRSAVVQ